MIETYISSLKIRAELYKLYLDFVLNYNSNLAFMLGASVLQHTGPKQARFVPMQRPDSEYSEIKSELFTTISNIAVSLKHIVLIDLDYYNKSARDDRFFVSVFYECDVERLADGFLLALSSLNQLIRQTDESGKQVATIIQSLFEALFLMRPRIFQFVWKRMVGPFLQNVVIEYNILVHDYNLMNKWIYLEFLDQNNSQSRHVTQFLDILFQFLLGQLPNFRGPRSERQEYFRVLQKRYKKRIDDAALKHLYEEAFIYALKSLFAKNFRWIISADEQYARKFAGYIRYFVLRCVNCANHTGQMSVFLYMLKVIFRSEMFSAVYAQPDPRRSTVFIQKLVQILDPLLLPLMRCLLTFMEDQQNMLQRDLPQLIMNLAICRSERMLEFGPFLRRCLPSLIGGNQHSVSQIEQIINKLTKPLQYFEREEIFAYLALLEGIGPMFTSKIIDCAAHHSQQDNLEFYFSKLGGHVRTLLEQKPLRLHSRSEEGLLVLLRNQFTEFTEVLQLSEIIDSSFKALIEHNKLFSFEDNFITLTLFMFLPAPHIDQGYLRARIKQIAERVSGPLPTGPKPQLHQNDVLSNFIDRFLTLNPRSLNCKTVSLHHFETMSRIFSKCTRLLMILFIRDNLEKAREWTTALIDYLSLVFIAKDGQLRSLVPNEADPLGFFLPVFDFIFSDTNNNQGHSVQRKEMKEYAELRGRFDMLSMGLFVLVRIISTCKSVLPDPEIVGHLEIVKLIISQLINHVFEKEKDNRYQDALFVVFEVLIYYLPASALRMHQRAFIAGLKSLLQSGISLTHLEPRQVLRAFYKKAYFTSPKLLFFDKAKHGQDWPLKDLNYLLVSVEAPSLQTEEEERALAKQLFLQFDESISLLMEGYLDLKPETGGKLLRRFLGWLHADRGITMIELISLNRLHIYFNPHSRALDPKSLETTLSQQPIRAGDSQTPSISMLIFEQIIAHSFRELERLPAQTSKLIHYLDTLQFFIHVPLLEVTINGNITPVFMVLLNELLDILKDDFFMYENALAHLVQRQSKKSEIDSILPLYERMEDQLVANTPFADHHVSALYYSDLFGLQSLEALRKMHLQNKANPREAPYLHHPSDNPMPEERQVVEGDLNPPSELYPTLKEQVEQSDFARVRMMEGKFLEVTQFETVECAYHGYHNIDKYLYQTFQLHAQHVRKLAVVLSLLVRILTHKDIIQRIKDAEAADPSSLSVREENLLYAHRLSLFFMLNMFKRVEKILVKAGKNVFRYLEQRFQMAARNELYQEQHFIHRQLQKLPLQSSILQKVGRRVFGMRVHRRFYQISVTGIELPELVEEMNQCRKELTDKETGLDFKQHIAKLRELWLIIPAIYKKAFELKQLQKSLPKHTEAFERVRMRYVPQDKMLDKLINGVVDVGLRLHQDGFLFGILDNKLQTGTKGTLGYAFIKACAAMGQDFAREALWKNHDLLPILAQAMKMREAYELRERISRSLPMILEQSIDSIERDRREMQRRVEEVNKNTMLPNQEKQTQKAQLKSSFEKSQYMLVKVIEQLVFAAPHWFAGISDLEKRISSFIRFKKSQFREHRETPSQYEIGTAQILINCMMLVLEQSKSPHPATLFSILKLANVLPLFEIAKLPDFIDKRAVTSGRFLSKTFLYFLHLVEDKHGTSYEELFILLNFGVLPIFKRFLLNIETESAKDPHSSSYYRPFSYENQLKRTLNIVHEQPNRETSLLTNAQEEPSEALIKMMGVLQDFTKTLSKPPLNMLLEALDRRQPMTQSQISVQSVPQYLTNWQLRASLFQFFNVVFTLQFRSKRWEGKRDHIYELSGYLNSLATICRYYCNREVRDAILLLEGRFHLMIRDFEQVPDLDQLLGRLIKLLMVKNRGDADLWADTLSRFLAFIVIQFQKEKEEAAALVEDEKARADEKLKRLRKQMSNDLVLALWQLMERSSKTFPHHKKFIENCQEYYFFAVNDNMIKYFEQIIARLYLRAEKDYEISFAIMAIDFSRILSLWMLRWQADPECETEFKAALKAIKLEEEVRRTCFIFLSEKQGQKIKDFLHAQLQQRESAQAAAAAAAQQGNAQGGNQQAPPPPEHNTPMLDLPDFKFKECMIYFTKRPKLEEYLIKMAQHIANVLEVRRRAKLNEPFKFKEVMIYIESAYLNLKLIHSSFMILFSQFLSHLLEYLVRELQPEYLQQSHLEILRLLKIIIGNGDSYFLVEMACQKIHYKFVNKMRQHAPELLKNNPTDKPELMIVEMFYHHSWQIMTEDFDSTEENLKEMARYPQPPLHMLKRLLPFFSIALHRQFNHPPLQLFPRFQQLMLRCLRQLINLKLMSMENSRKQGTKDRFLPPVEPLEWKKYVTKVKYLSFEFARLLPCAFEDHDIGINKVYQTLVTAIQIMNLQLQNLSSLMPEEKEEVFIIFSNMLQVLSADPILQKLVGLISVGPQGQVINTPARLETKVRLMQILVQKINKLENKFQYKKFIDRVFTEVYHFHKHSAVFSEAYTDLLQEVVFNHLGIEHQRRRIQILTAAVLGKSLFSRMKFIVGRWVTDKLEQRAPDVWLFASTMILLGSFEIKPLQPEFFKTREQPPPAFSTLRCLEGPEPVAPDQPNDFLRELVLQCKGFLSNKGRAYITNSWLMSIGTVIQISIGYSQRLFLRIFPICWNGLQRSEQSQLVTAIELFIRRVAEMKPQLTETCIVPLLEVCARCSPQVVIEPLQLHSLTRNAKIWHLVIPLLQSGFLRHPNHEIYYVTLSNLYEETKDKDSLAALHRLMANVPESRHGATLSQAGLYLQAAECFFTAINKYISTINNFSNFAGGEDSEATGPAGTYQSGYESAGSQSHVSDDSYATFHDGQISELNERFEESLRLSLDEAEHREGERRQLPRQVDMRIWEKEYIKAMGELDNWADLEDIAADSGSELLSLEIAMRQQRWEKAAELNQAICSSSEGVSSVPEFFETVRKAVAALTAGGEDNDTQTMMSDEKQNELLKLLRSEFQTVEQLQRWKPLNSKAILVGALSQTHLAFEMKEWVFYLRKLSETLFRREPKLTNEALAKLLACWRDRTLVPSEVFAKEQFGLFRKRMAYHDSFLGLMEDTFEQLGQTGSFELIESAVDGRRELNLTDARIRLQQQRAWGRITVAGVQRKRGNVERALTEIMAAEEAFKLIEEKFNSSANIVASYELYRLAKEQLKLAQDGLFDLIPAAFHRSQQALEGCKLRPQAHSDLLRLRALVAWKKDGFSERVEVALLNSAFADQTSAKPWMSLAKYYRALNEREPTNTRALTERIFATGRAIQFAPKLKQQTLAVQLFLLFADQTVFVENRQFQPGSAEAVEKSLRECLEMVPVWSWIFWIPQLMQRICCEDLSPQAFSLTESILTKLAAVYPQALFPLLHGELLKIREEEQQGHCSMPEATKQALVRLDQKIKREQNRNIQEINKLQQLLGLLHVTLDRSPEEKLDSALKIALSELSDVATAPVGEQVPGRFQEVYQAHLRIILGHFRSTQAGSILEDARVLSLIEGLVEGANTLPTEAVVRVKQVSDLVHNLVAMQGRSLFVKERCDALLGLNLRNIERFLLLQQLVEPSIDRRQYFSRIFTELRHEHEHHHSEVHFEVNNSYDVQLLHREFGSLRYDTPRLHALFLKQLTELLKSQVFPRHPATSGKLNCFIQCNFMLSYPFSLSRQDIAYGLSLRSIAHQLLTERGYDLHTPFLLKAAGSGLPLVRQMAQGPFPKSALTEFLQRSFHVSASEDVFVFKRRFSASWGAQGFLHWVLQLEKRNLDNVVLLINKCSLTTRDPSFTLSPSSPGMFLSSEAVPLRYSQSFKYYFGRFGREGAIPGAMTAASLAVRHFKVKVRDILTLFYLSAFQNLTHYSRPASAKGSENANHAMRRALALSSGLDPEEEEEVVEAEQTHRGGRAFNQKVEELLLHASLESNYEKMPLSWAAWL